MISNAFALAILTTAGLVVVYKKLPRKIRRFIEKYHLLADLLALIGVYLLMGQTLTALMAGALAGLFTSVLLHIANNEQDFLYLYDARDWLKSQMKVAKEALNVYGEKYRTRKKDDEDEEEAPNIVDMTPEGAPA